MPRAGAHHRGAVERHADEPRLEALELAILGEPAADAMLVGIALHAVDDDAGRGEVEGGHCGSSMAILLDGRRPERSGLTFQVEIDNVTRIHDLAQSR